MQSALTPVAPWLENVPEQTTVGAIEKPGVLPASFWAGHPQATEFNVY
jgi:hypothetical protein